MEVNLKGTISLIWFGKCQKAREKRNLPYYVKYIVRGNIKLKALISARLTPLSRNQHLYSQPLGEAHVTQLVCICCNHCLQGCSNFAWLLLICI